LQDRSVTFHMESQKNVRPCNQSGLQLACGKWLARQEYTEYELHRSECCLCKPISIDTAIDMRYDVLLPCAEQFVRILSRPTWRRHQCTCTKCDDVIFDDLQSLVTEKLRGAERTTSLSLSDLTECIVSTKTFLTNTQIVHCNQTYSIHCNNDDGTTFRILAWFENSRIELSWSTDWDYRFHVGPAVWICWWRFLQLQQERALHTAVEHGLCHLPDSIANVVNTYICVSYSHILHVLPIILQKHALKSYEDITNDCLQTMEASLRNIMNS